MSMQVFEISKIDKLNLNKVIVSILKITKIWMNKATKLLHRVERHHASW